MIRPLDERGRQRGAELRTVGEIDLAEGLHGVDRLHHGDGDPGDS